jgi:hypothetical protein
MKHLLVRMNFTLRRAICYFLGHKKVDGSLHTVGLRHCLRCLRIVDYRTVRRRVTRGDIERRMVAHPPEGYSFVSCNWKKRKAKFVSQSGRLKFIHL